MLWRMRSQWHALLLLDPQQADEHALTVALGRTPEEIVEEIEAKLRLAKDDHSQEKTGFGRA